jgi:hypothetical protein
MAEATSGQKRLLAGLFVVALLVAVLGFVVIWFLTA